MDTCSGAEIACNVRVVVAGEVYEGDCEEMQEHFDIPEDHDDDDDDDHHDCESYVCDELYGCREDYGDKLDHCMVYSCYNECNYHEECMVEYVDKRGQDGRADCETFYQHMENDDDHHDEDDDDEECGIWEDEYDCKDLASEYVEYLDECKFVEKYDSCREEVVECKVTVKVMGQEYEGDCEEIAEEFGVPLDEIDDECEVTCMEPFPCHGETPYEWCEMVECYDHCYEESVCYAEWTDMNGEYQSAECEELHHEEECDKHGRAEPVCEYEQCDKMNGGDCWFEKCASQDECGKPTCTKWWYDEKRNYWTAEDCQKKEDKAEDIDIEQFFHHTVNFISHYDDTFELISEHFLGDVLGLSDPIDMWLSNSGAKYAASVVIQDTEEALNYLGMDVDFDPIHAALEAESLDELHEMLGNIDFDELMDDMKDDDKHDDYDRDYDRDDYRNRDEDDYDHHDYDNDNEWDWSEDDYWMDDYSEYDRYDSEWDMDYSEYDRYDSEWDMDYSEYDRFDSEWDMDYSEYDHQDSEWDMDFSEYDHNDSEWDMNDSEWDMTNSEMDMNDSEWDMTVNNARGRRGPANRRIVRPHGPRGE